MFSIIIWLYGIDKQRLFQFWEWLSTIALSLIFPLDGLVDCTPSLNSLSFILYHTNRLHLVWNAPCLVWRTRYPRLGNGVHWLGLLWSIPFLSLIELLLALKSAYTMCGLKMEQKTVLYGCIRHGKNLMLLKNFQECANEGKCCRNLQIPFTELTATPHRPLRDLWRYQGSIRLWIASDNMTSSIELCTCFPISPHPVVNLISSEIEKELNRINEFSSSCSMHWKWDCHTHILSKWHRFSINM